MPFFQKIDPQKENQKWFSPSVLCLSPEMTILKTGSLV